MQRVRSTLFSDKSGHSRKSGRRKRVTFVKRLSDDKLAPPQHFATSGIHSLRCPPPLCNRVRRYSNVECSSPAFYVCICVCLADPSVIRRDGFAAREAREAKRGTSRELRNSREELEAQNEKRTGHVTLAMMSVCSANERISREI